MSKLFGNLSNDGLEQSQDRLGGYQPFESDIYNAKIKVAYAGESRNGAQSITLIADADGREYRETIYITNRNKENFFISKDKKKVPLPGFTHIDDICLIATGKPLAEQDTEDKMINIYDPEEKKEVPKSVPVLVELIGQEVALGIQKILENKNEQDSSGKWVPTEEERTSNAIDKVFHPEMKLTVAEARDGKEEPKFWNSWLARNKDQVRDNREIKAGEGGSSGRPSRSGPPAASAAKTERPSLFGNKK